MTSLGRIHSVETDRPRRGQGEALPPLPCVRLVADTRLLVDALVGMQSVPHADWTCCTTLHRFAIPSPESFVEPTSYSCASTIRILNTLDIADGNGNVLYTGGYADSVLA